MSVNLNSLKDTCSKFADNIRDIQAFIKKLITADSASDFYSLKRSDLLYNGLIITLYGLFERFVESIGLNYLDNVCEIDEIERKDSEHCIKQIILSTFLNNIVNYSQNPQRYTNIEYSEALIAELFKGYSIAFESGDFSLVRLNDKFIVFHSFNMRSSEMLTLLRNIGIENPEKEICTQPAFRNYLITELGIEEANINRATTNPESDVFMIINQLVEQRNVVAHTGKSENRITLNEIADQTIPYLIHLSDAIKNTLIQNIILNFNFDAKKPFKESKINNVFDNCLVCHKNENYIISIGDYLVVKKGDCDEAYQIESIGLDGDNTIVQTESSTDELYCFKINGVVKENNQLIGFVAAKI